MTQENSNGGKFREYISRSVTIKAITIVILMLLLMIPNSMIEMIIYDREQMNQAATMEVSERWARNQQLTGPILTIPYKVNISTDDKVKRVQRYFHILPETLNINGEVLPKELYRGIYKVAVYESKISMNGHFEIPEMPFAEKEDIEIEDAFFTWGISDLRGIQDEIDMVCNQEKLSVSPGSQIPTLVPLGVSVDASQSEKIIENIRARDKIDFQLDINLQGSRNLSFVPLGSVTDINLSSPWPSPKFVGNFLPDERNVDKDGFQANWKVLQLNRPFPQSFVGNQQAHALQESTFGVDFLISLDDYQKSIRSVKYAGMTIALTFLIFFLVELLNKKKIHPLQYALVGLGLCLFYILLVSFSEHMLFNTAFFIAASAIITMIGLYSMSIFQEKKHVIILIFSLICVYLFLFTTLQLADYALLIGSIGLFIVLSITMYFTRKIDWYSS